MPEGHTIHRAARDQQPMLVGSRLDVSSPQGRFLEGAARLDGQTCIAVEAFGKHLIYRFAFGEALHIHLGLFGRFRTTRRPAGEPRGAVRVRLMSDTHVVDINGPNSCEVLDAPALSSLVERIGPDVLRADAEPDRAWRRIGKSRAPIGLLLMDQSVIAGIGNIYRSELLWRARIHPLTPGGTIGRDAFDALWRDAATLLEIGVRANAIITVDGARKSRTKYGERVNIFGKEACPSCSSAIRRFEMGGRRVFSCDTCQPLEQASALA